MRFHLVSLPHTQTTREFISCAYTQKVVKFAKMMKARGHEIVLYSGEENEAPCDEHVVMVKSSEQRKWWGPKRLDQMYPITWNHNDMWWQKTNDRVIAHLKKGLKSGAYDVTDFVCVIAGTCNERIAYHVPNLTPEYGVGYTGIFTHAAFESHFHRATVYKLRGIEDGRAYDEVIPNYFDPEEFLAADGVKREDHLLYVGRLIQRKGLAIAVQAAERSGRKLLLAGQGYLEYGKKRDGRQFVESDEMRLEGNLEYIGVLGVEERAREMARAHAVLAPTTYIEPFGGVAVEAGFCGTPAITTNWGAYVETILPENGFRANIMRDYVKAIHDAGKLGRNRAKIVKSVTDRYSLEAVAPLYEEWFDRLSTLHGDGFYAE